MRAPISKNRVSVRTMTYDTERLPMKNGVTTKFVREAILTPPSAPPDGASKSASSARLPVVDANGGAAGALATFEMPPAVNE